MVNLLKTILKFTFTAALVTNSAGPGYLHPAGPSYALRPMSSGVSQAPQSVPNKKYPEQLQPFEGLAKAFSDRIKAEITEIENLIKEDDAPLALALDAIKLKSHIRDLSAETDTSEKRDSGLRSPREILIGQIDCVKKLAEDVPLENDSDEILDKLSLQLMKVTERTVRELKTDAEQGLFADVNARIKSLIVSICIYRNLCAVLRNSDYFTHERLEEDIKSFSGHPEKDLLERVSVANAFLFVTHNTAGIVALFSRESFASMDAKARYEVSEIVGLNAYYCMMMAEETFRTNISIDLCLRCLSKEADTDPKATAEALSIFVDENAFNIEALGQGLKKPFIDKIIAITNQENELRSVEKMSSVLVTLDPIRALEVVREEWPDHMAYLVFRELQAGLARGQYPSQIASKIESGLKKKAASSQWPKLNPKDLKAHTESQTQQRLCHFLELGQRRVSNHSASTEVFKAYYPDGEPKQEFSNALSAAYEVMAKMPRHLFIFPPAMAWAFVDEPLQIPLGHGQTISQPSLVHWMTALLNPKKTDRVLEIGTGGGYQAAILSRMTKEVHTIEVYSDLAKNAQKTCKNLGIANIKFYNGDGSAGLKEQGPFDIIVVTAGAPATPDTLLEQLNEDGGRLLIAENPEMTRGGVLLYKLVLYIRQGKKSYKKFEITGTQWVPLVGKYGHRTDKPDDEANLDEPVLLEEPQDTGLGHHQNVVPVITPFKRVDGAIVIDRDGIRNHLHYLKSISVKSILVMGATGEFMHLSNEQRLEAIRIFAEESQGRFTIFANATAEDEKTTRKNIRELNKIPFISAVAVAPLCYLKNNREAFLHIKSIESELPVVLYNNPGIHKVKGRSIRPPVVRMLRNSVTGIKDSSGKLELLRKYAEYMPTFQGDELYITKALRYGAIGAVSSMGNALSLPQEVFEEEKEESDRITLQLKIKNLVTPLTADRKKIPAGLKYYLWLIGVLPSYEVADPDMALDDAEKKEIKEIRVELGGQENPELLSTADLVVIDQAVKTMVAKGNFEMDQSSVPYDFLADMLEAYIHTRYPSLNETTWIIIDENIKQIPSAVLPDYADSARGKPDYQKIQEAYSHLDEVNFSALRDLMILSGEVGLVLGESIIEKNGLGSTNAERAFTALGGFLTNFSDQIRNIHTHANLEGVSDENQQALKAALYAFDIFNPRMRKLSEGRRVLSDHEDTNSAIPAQIPHPQVYADIDTAA